MAPDSFNDVLDQVVSTLENAGDLQDYCGEQLGGALKVVRKFQHRGEVSLNALPLCMVTSPDREAPGEKPEVQNAHNRIRTLRLYYGFVSRDPEAAQSRVVRLDELIEEALLNDDTLEALVMDIRSGRAANDEGRFHPVYFGVSDFTIWQRVRG